MALKNYSKFYYVQPITVSDNAIAFTEDGATEIVAEVAIGRYTVTELANAVQNALNTNGSLAYSVSFNRQTRRFLITANGDFSLLGGSSTIIGVDIFGIIGFAGQDTVFGNSALSFDVVGSVFSPQFYLQNYVSPEQFQEAVSGVRAVTASGEVEVVRFGVQNFVEMDIRFQNNGIISGSPFRDSLTGYDDLVEFMRFITNIYPVEFMPDENDLNDFMVLNLESTQGNQNGLGFKLKERFDIGLPNVFDTGVLKFRKVR